MTVLFILFYVAFVCNRVHVCVHVYADRLWYKKVSRDADDAGPDVYQIISSYGES